MQEVLLGYEDKNTNASTVLSVTNKFNHNSMTSVSY